MFGGLPVVPCGRSPGPLPASREEANSPSSPRTIPRLLRLSAATSSSSSGETFRRIASASSIAFLAAGNSRSSVSTSPKWFRLWDISGWFSGNTLRRIANASSNAFRRPSNFPRLIRTTPIQLRTRATSKLSLPKCSVYVSLATAAARSASMCLPVRIRTLACFSFLRPSSNFVEHRQVVLPPFPRMRLLPSVERPPVLLAQNFSSSASNSFRSATAPSKSPVNLRSSATRER